MLKLPYMRFAGFAIGIPYFPGISDNILLGVIGVASPILHRNKVSANLLIIASLVMFNNYKKGSISNCNVICTPYSIVR